ncbi:MAG TPA: 4Fe-4S binding protein [Anaerolineales bacterium]|nr:4Fe-4S binding protein [Anaerolineales bacterium]
MKTNTFKNNLMFKNLVVPLVVMVAFVGVGLWGFLASGYTQPLIMFGYIGVSLGVGLGLYGMLPKKQKPIGRRLTLFLVGLFLIGFAIFMGHENTQIEGALIGLLTGVVQMGVIHYAIAKIFGPLLFGRMWCGWACWTVMILDLLPFKRPSGRLPRQYGWLRYLHFFLSLSIVLLLVYVVGFREGATGTIAVTWFITGNLLYYAVGIVLAYTLKDNRAFCKYVCPVSVPLKVTSRFSVIKIGQGAGQCNDCDACEKMCPMDVRISDYILNNQRVLSTECSLCQTCFTVCAQDALKLSFGFDVSKEDLLRERAPKVSVEAVAAD